MYSYWNVSKTLHVTITLHGGCCLIITINKTSRKWKTNILWTIALSSFSNFHKYITHDKIIHFDAALLVEKNTMRVGYAERSIKNLWP